MTKLSMIVDDDIGIVNHIPGTPNEAVISLFAAQRQHERDHILVVDYPLFNGRRDEIEAQLPDWVRIIDHHAGYTGSCLTATAGVIDSLDELARDGFNPNNTVVVTGQANYDPDGVLAMVSFMAQDWAQRNKELIKKVAYFSDNTGFGGVIFNDDYSPSTPEEKIAFALLEDIYEETVENFSSSVALIGGKRAVEVLKGFPAPDFQGVVAAVLQGYSMTTMIVHEIFETPDQYGMEAEHFVDKVRRVNADAEKRVVRFMDGTFLYYDLTEEPLDKTGVPFWLAEGYGKWLKGGRFVLTKSALGYTLASADKGPDQPEEPYPLTKVAPLLGDGWFGKDTILFGPKGERAFALTPEEIADKVRQTY